MLKGKAIHSVLSLLFIISLTSAAQAEIRSFEVYEFKKNDSVSKVMHEKNIKPLFGKGGKVKKILKLNRLDNDQAKLLNPGDLIVLPTQSILASDKNDVEALILSGNADKLMTHLAAAQKSNYDLDSSDRHSSDRHNKTYRVGQFYRTMQLANNTKVNTFQNFNTSVTYSYHNLNYGNWSYAPKIEAGLTMQNVEAKNYLNGLYIAGLDIHDYRHAVTFSPILERENYARIIQTQNGQDVRKNLDYRAGFSLSKQSHFLAFGEEQMGWAMFSYAKSIETTNSRLTFRAGVKVARQLGVEFFGEQYNFDKFKEQMQSFGIGMVFKL